MKHHLKQILAMFLAFALVLGFAAVPAGAAQTKPVNEVSPSLVEGFSTNDSALTQNTEEIRILVCLGGSTEFARSGDLQLAASAVPEVRSAQNTAIGNIQSALHQSIQVENRFCLLFNGFSFTGQRWMLEEINKLQGISAIECPELELIEPEAANQNVTLTPSMSTATQMTTVSEAWDLGYTGEGKVIAIIDSGIHQTHEAFSVMPENGKIDREYLENLYAQYGDVLHAGSVELIDQMYYSEKLPFNWDYFDNDAIPNHTASDHGTHVAGIAAGNNGKDFRGAAPDAQIISLQIFANTGGASIDTLLCALEDCVYLGVDVVSMSLGLKSGFSSYQSLGQEFQDVFEALENAGISVSAAAGNDYNSLYWTNYGNLYYYDYTGLSSNPDVGTISAPASFPAPLAVASVVNSAPSGYMVAYGAEIGFTAVAGVPTMGELEPGEYELVYCGLGYPEEIAAVGDLTGKIALIQRGTLTHTEKVANAVSAGAVAVIYFNNSDAVLNPSVVSAVPWGMIPRSAALKILENMTDGTYGRVEIFGGVGYTGIAMAQSSSWGSTGDLLIKPDLAAPGDGITSAVAWLYQSIFFPAGDHEYSTWSGTSMATPHVSASLMLIRQRVAEAFPDLAGKELVDRAYALAMSTAHQVSGFVRQQGAGLIDVGAALTTEVYLSVPTNDRPKIELGENEDGTFTFTFTLNNFGKSTHTYDIVPVVITEKVGEEYYSGPDFDANGNKMWGTDYEPTLVKTINGTVYDVTELCNITGSKSVTVKAGETATVTMTIACTDELLTYFRENCPNGMYLEGFIKLKETGNNPIDLSIPFLGFVGDWDQAPMLDNGWYWETATGAFSYKQLIGLAMNYMGYMGNQGFGLNIYADMEGMTYLADRNAISPNGDGIMDGLTYVKFVLMRNAQKTRLLVEDENGNILQTLFEGEYYFRKDAYTEPNASECHCEITDLAFFGEGLAEGETVYIVLENYPEHEGYDITKNESGRWVVPVTIDLTAPTLTPVDGGVEIFDANYIATYEVYADPHQKNLIHEADLFAEERGITEFFATELETYYVAVADYAGNEMFYMVRDGQIYTMDAPAFTHGRTVVAQRIVDWNRGIYDYDWISFQSQLPDKVTIRKELPDDYVIPITQDGIAGDSSITVDIVSATVDTKGNLYGNDLRQIYKIDPVTFEREVVFETDPAVVVKNIEFRPGTDEMYLFVQGRPTTDVPFGIYLCRYDLETDELTYLFKYPYGTAALAFCFISSDRVLFWEQGGPYFSIYDLSGNQIERFWVGVNDGTGSIAIGYLTSYSSDLLYDPDLNSVYLQAAWNRFGTLNFNSGGLVRFDLDTRTYHLLELGEPGGNIVGGLYFEDQVKGLECIYYLQEVAPTCFSEGYTLHTCADCGKEYRDNFVPALEHEYETVVTEPTCTEMGYTTYTCAVCGDSYVADYTLPIDHEFVEVVIEPTCTEAGYTIYMCECGYEVIDDVVDPIAHSYTVNVIAPTCDTFGFTEHICTVCGDYYVSDYTAPYCPSAQFTDVALDAWYHEAVDFVLVAGLMNGMSETEFAPENNMTRAQLVTVLYRLAGSPSVEGLEHPFADVAAETWYTDAVIWAYNAEVVNGVSDTAFAPNANITREQLVAVLYRFYGEPEANTLVLADYADANTISDYAVNAMAWAVENGIVNGLTENTLAPRGTATRAQIATILMRLA